MNKKRIIIIISAIIAVIIGTTLTFTIGYFSDRKAQSVTLKAANLDYSVTARFTGSACFDNYEDDIRIIEFTLTNNSDNEIHNILGLNPQLCFENTYNSPLDDTDFLVYPSSVNGTKIQEELAECIYNQNYKYWTGDYYPFEVGEITVPPHQTIVHKVKLAIGQLGDTLKGNVIEIEICDRISTGNSSGGEGFTENLEDNNEDGILYAFTNQTETPTDYYIEEGWQEKIIDVDYSQQAYTTSEPLINLKNATYGIKNRTRCWFRDYEGKLADYGLTLGTTNTTNGILYGTPTKSLPAEYHIYLEYKSPTSWYAAWTPYSSNLWGNYVGCVTLRFHSSSQNLSSAIIGDISNQTYDGSEKKPTPTITYNGNTLIKDTDYTVSYSNNINAGTATFTATGKGNYTGSISKTFTINKANSSVTTLPTANNLTYNGSAQTLISTGSCSGGTLYYRLYSYTNNSGSTSTYSNSYSTSRPTGSAAGTYVVQYYVSGDSNHNDTSISTINITINRASFTSSVSIAGYTYAGTKSTPSVTNNPGGGSVTYYGRSTSGGTSTNWSSVTSTTYNAGTRYCYAIISATNNYNSCVTSETSFTISKANASISTSPSAISPTYNRHEQTLISAGSSSQGTVYYRIYSYQSTTASDATTYSNSYSTVLPTGTDAGTYVIQYYVSSSNTTNYNNSGTYTVTAYIEQYDISYAYHDEWKSYYDDEVAIYESYIERTYSGSDLKNEASNSIYLYWDSENYDLIYGTDYTTSFTDSSCIYPGTYYFTVNGYGNYTGSFNHTLYIRKANSYVSSAPSANSLTYTGSAQTLTTSGTASNGTMYYRLYQYKSPTASSYTTYSNSYSTTRPTGTAAGTYIVQYYSKGNAYYDDSSVNTVTITINARAISSATVSTISSYTYDGSEKKPTPTITYNSKTLSNGTDYSLSYSNNTNAGTSTASVIITGKGNFSGSTTKYFTINKASQNAPTSLTASVSDTTVTLTASGSGSTTLQYSKDNTNWQTSNVFSDLDEGTYTFYARYSSTTNYNASANKTTTATIDASPYIWSGTKITGVKEAYKNSKIFIVPSKTTDISSTAFGGTLPYVIYIDKNDGTIPTSAGTKAWGGSSTTTQIQYKDTFFTWSGSTITAKHDIAQGTKYIIPPSCTNITCELHLTGANVYFMANMTTLPAKCFSANYSGKSYLYILSPIKTISSQAIICTQSGTANTEHIYLPSTVTTIASDAFKERYSGSYIYTYLDKANKSITGSPWGASKVTWNTAVPYSSTSPYTFAANGLDDLQLPDTSDTDTMQIKQDSNLELITEFPIPSVPEIPSPKPSVDGIDSIKSGSGTTSSSNHIPKPTQKPKIKDDEINNDSGENLEITNDSNNSKIDTEMTETINIKSDNDNNKKDTNSDETKGEEKVFEIRLPDKNIKKEDDTGN